MRSKEFLPELVTRANDITHFRRRIALAARLCAQLGDRPLVFRAFKHAQDSITLLAKVSHGDWAHPQDRRAGTNRQAQMELMQRLGIKHPTFCTLTPPQFSREFHGRAHVFIPLTDSPPWYSPRVVDLGSGRIINDQGQQVHGGATDGGSNWSSHRVGWMNDRVQEFADTYVHAWPAGYTHHELIFDSDTYYLLNMEDFFTRFAGAELRSVLPPSHPRQPPPLHNPIDPSAWLRVKTYQQVADFLMTTAPEYLDRYERQMQERQRQATVFHQVNTAWQQGGGLKNPRSWAQVAQDLGVQLAPDDTRD